MRHIAAKFSNPKAEICYGQFCFEAQIFLTRCTSFESLFLKSINFAFRWLKKLNNYTLSLGVSEYYF